MPTELELLLRVLPAAVPGGTIGYDPIAVTPIRSHMHQHGPVDAEHHT